MMSLSSRLLILLGFAMVAGMGQAATTTKSKSSGSSSKSKSSGTTKSRPSASPSSKAGAETASSSKPAGSESSAKPDTPAEKKAEKAVPKEDTPKPPRPAAVSTVSIEQISGFDDYPKQIQSLVQSALALTHLELRYMYGSHEPHNGGMDCSGTIYHVLRFQGLKDVPRQSDEMAMWVDKKSRLHLTPTATDFDSPEFKDLKPGDMLFWTNTTATTRKLPVTHVMLYLGKLKGSGKRIIFGASDGRSFSGQRRSGVSVFDFHLPRAEGTARLHGYGPPPGLLPQEAVLAAAKPPAPATSPAASIVAAASKPEELAKNETPKAPERVDEPRPMYTKVSPPSAPASTPKDKEEPGKEATVAAAPPTPGAMKNDVTEAGPPGTSASAVAPESAPATPQEEVRKAVAMTGDALPEAAASAADQGTSAKSAAAKADEPAQKPATSTGSKAKASSSSSSKAKAGGSAKKRSAPVSTRRRTPAPPPKSSVERALDNAVNSVRRIFR